MLLPDVQRVVLPQCSADVIMMTADRRYWTDPVWRRNVIEWLRYFKSIETEVIELTRSQTGVFEADFNNQQGG